MQSTPKAVLGAAILALASPLMAAEKPAGWTLAGKEPSSYVMEIDKIEVHGGKLSATLASSGEPQGFGTMLQSFEPVDYRGKRLQLSAFVKSRDVKKWAGLWMRVDGPEQGKSLAFDNMNDRPIKGSHEWTRYVIVLDVPEAATNLAFGVLLDGQGKVWVDDLQFQVVDTTVPTTGMVGHAKPKNLDFEQ